MAEQRIRYLKVRKKDATGGFKLWKTEVLNSIDFRKVKSSGYSFQIEMNFRAWRLDASIIEDSIIFVDRTIGESKMSKSISSSSSSSTKRTKINESLFSLISVHFLE